MYYYKIVNEKSETISLQSSSMPLNQECCILMKKDEWQQLMDNYEQNIAIIKKQRIKQIQAEKRKAKIEAAMKDVEIVETNQIIEVQEEDLE